MEIMPATVRDDRFVFAFTRNPWDRLVSLYLYFQRMNRFFVGPFDAFIRSVTNGVEPVGHYNYRFMSMANQQTAWFDLGNGRTPDFIGRYETLQDDWYRLADALHVPTPPLLWETPKPEIRTPYQESYDAKTQQLVATTYAEEIERFGYRFDA